ncbi:serine hydrolase domain-containing protein [Lacrimispora amygdalina]|uniref:serine hydrolase domain-containing protein n=1 Tax=Lacrimispora amygdalina TaxID=253257 RepID=UPI001478B2D0|nr:serine hydrolase domain-containing protein [Clostridium indicum]
MDRITEENRKKFEKLVEMVMSEQRAVGIAVAIVDKSGKVQYEKYFGYRDEEKKLPIDEHTIFGLASVTKSFTSLAIMKMAEDGIISLDDPISKYVPFFTNKNQNAPVKIWHLLCHSGGFYPLPRIVVDKVAEEMGLTEAKVGDLAYNEALATEGAKRVAGRLDEQTDLIGLPGEIMSYCNDGFGILSDIIKNYGDQPSFAEYLLKHIIRPLDMERSFCDFLKPSLDNNAATLYTNEEGIRRATRDYHDDAFVLNGGGAMKSTMSDMLKYICMYLNEGRGLNSKRIASEYSIREMCKPRQYYRPGGWYGYGLCLKSIDEINVIEHGGSLPGVSSNMSWSYEAEAGVMVLCNTMDVSSGVIADAAMRMYQGKDPVAPSMEYPEFSWSKEFINAVSGDYVMGEGERFTLSMSEEGKLAMTFNGKKKEIRPVNPYLAITPGKFSNGFVQILYDEKRGIWGARCGSRIYPKVS